MIASRRAAGLQPAYQYLLKEVPAARSLQPINEAPVAQKKVIIELVGDKATAINTCKGKGAVAVHINCPQPCFTNGRTICIV